MIELQLDGGSGTPVVLKELVRHPVSGETVHIDLLRVRLDVAIQAQVPLELTDEDQAPGVALDGGILEHTLREVTIEALPTAIPDAIQVSVATMNIGDVLTLSAVVAPEGVTIIGDDDITIATVSASRLARAEGEGEIELETEVVGEGGEAGESAGGDSGSDSDAD